MNKRYSNFFDDEGIKKPFADVLTEVQEYISSKFSTLLSDNPEEQKKQIGFFNFASFPITLTSKATGKSEVYWK